MTDLPIDPPTMTDWSLRQQIAAANEALAAGPRHPFDEDALRFWRRMRDVCQTELDARAGSAPTAA